MWLSRFRFFASAPETVSSPSTEIAVSGALKSESIWPKGKKEERDEQDSQTQCVLQGTAIGGQLVEHKCYFQDFEDRLQCPEQEAYLWKGQHQEWDRGVKSSMAIQVDDPLSSGNGSIETSLRCNRDKLGIM